MATGSNGVEEIYQRMALIRREPHTNVRESVAGAEAFVDWGRYAWTYPWIAVGAAVALGCLAYAGGRPKKKAVASDTTEEAEFREPLAEVSTQSQVRSRIGKDVLIAAWGVLLPVAVRAGQNFILHWLERHYSAATPVEIGQSPTVAKMILWNAQPVR